MSVLVHVEVDAKPECVEEFTQFLSEILPDTRAYDGCIDINIYLNDNGHTLAFIQNWESKEHHQKYFAWRGETGDAAKLGSYLQGPPTIRYFEKVA
jgi:quinol monooxygenase YgiN